MFVNIEDLLYFYDRNTASVSQQMTEYFKSMAALFKNWSNTNMKLHRLIKST